MVLAARGTRNLDAGDEPVNDDEIERKLRKQALKVYVESALMAVALTGLVIVLHR